MVNVCDKCIEIDKLAIIGFFCVVISKKKEEETSPNFTFSDENCIKMLAKYLPRE